MKVDAGCIDFEHSTLGWSGRTLSRFRVLEFSRYSLLLKFCSVSEYLPSRPIAIIRTPVNDVPRFISYAAVTKETCFLIVLAYAATRYRSGNLGL